MFGQRFTVTRSTQIEYRRLIVRAGTGGERIADLRQQRIQIIWQGEDRA